MEAGQILYRIDASSMESKLSSASNSLERAQSSYDTAVSDYNEAVGKYSGNTYKATKSGYIKQLYIEAGDKVASNTQIADIYNDQIMKIKVPFLNMEAAAIAPGSPAVLTFHQIVCPSGGFSQVQVRAGSGCRLPDEAVLWAAG